MFEEYMILMFVVTIVGGLVMYWITSAAVRAPGRALQSKFVSLGVLKGKRKEGIIAVVGQPNSVSATSGGGQLLQWISTGYHIALIFDANGICQGVTHETAV
jgi:hypothetical protein